MASPIRYDQFNIKRAGGEALDMGGSFFLLGPLALFFPLFFLTKCFLACRTSVTGFITKVKQEADAALGDMVIP